MSNDGLRVIERRGSDLFWTMTDRGVEHNGKRRRFCRLKVSVVGSISI